MQWHFANRQQKGYLPNKKSVTNHPSLYCEAIDVHKTICFIYLGERFSVYLYVVFGIAGCHPDLFFHLNYQQQIEASAKPWYFFCVLMEKEFNIFRVLLLVVYVDIYIYIC